MLVKPGDRVAVDDSLVTLESDKATMDVPSPAAGTVKNLGVKVGDKVSEGSVVLTLDGRRHPAQQRRGDGARAASPGMTERRRVRSRAAAATIGAAAAELITPAPRGEKGRADMPGEGASATPPAGPTIEVRVPDIGDFKDVPVIEVFVKPGDIVHADDPLVTIESDKATMDVPAPVGGTVEGVRISVGERVSEGTPLLTLKTSQTGAEPASRSDAADAAGECGSRGAADRNGAITPTLSRGGRGRDEARERPDETQRTTPAAQRSGALSRPRRGAGGEGRACVTLGAQVRARARRRARPRNGSGPKGRIMHEDVQQFVKRALTAPASGARPRVASRRRRTESAAVAQVDFAKFGPIESKPIRASGRSPARTSHATG